MPASSLLTLIDDVATILDDVALLTKAATKKTAGVLGDDLALNAEQVTGVRAERELPVVWAVAKGSLVNKAILVPAALLLSAVAPFAVTPLLMLGGAFLCFEGAEKLAHKFLHGPEDAAHHDELRQAILDPSADLKQVEKDKIKGAVRTDFILSAEIITIALGTVATEPFGVRVSVLIAIAALMTVGVYGLVAAIVKLDDLGVHLTRSETGSLRHRVGLGVLTAAPLLMKGLSVAGTIAMFLVGGGILTHGLPFLHGPVEAVAHAAEGVPFLGWFLSIALDLVVGLTVGALLVVAVNGAKGLLRRGQPSSG